MNPSPHVISKPAKVKFRSSSEIQEGFIVFTDSHTGRVLTPEEKSQFTFLLNNSPQFEKVFDFFDVDMITFI